MSEVPRRPVVDLTETSSEAGASGSSGPSNGDGLGSTSGSTAASTSTSQTDGPADDASSQSLANLTCSICLGPPTPLTVTQCGHALCGGCLASSLEAQGPPPNSRANNWGELDGSCPVCRHPLRGGWGKSLRGARLRMAVPRAEQ